MNVFEFIISKIRYLGYVGLFSAALATLMCAAFIYFFYANRQNTASTIHILSCDHSSTKFELRISSLLTKGGAPDTYVAFPNTAQDTLCQRGVSYGAENDIVPNSGHKLSLINSGNLRLDFYRLKVRGFFFSDHNVIKEVDLIAKQQTKSNKEVFAITLKTYILSDYKDGQPINIDLYTYEEIESHRYYFLTYEPTDEVDLSKIVSDYGYYLIMENGAILVPEGRLSSTCREIESLGFPAPKICQ